MATMKEVHSTFPLDATLLVGEDISIYEHFLQNALSNDNHSLIDLLSSIPHPTQNSYGPLSILSALLSALPGPWPVAQLQLAYSKAWNNLPEEGRAGHISPQARNLLDRVLRQCKQSYTSLVDLLDATSTTPAIIDPENGRFIRHDALAASIRSFKLPLSTSCQPKPVVAIALPNGPLLALTVLATSTYYTAAPVAHGKGVGAEQFKTDVLQSRASLVLASECDVSRLGLHDPWLQDTGIEVALVELDDDMALAMRDLEGISMPKSTSTIVKASPNHADDTGILLFTSGTSGTKKLVPVNVHSMVCGAAMVIDSWDLSPSMRCLNQMPLNHVGGLIRNLYAPILSGGSVICCSAFDANLFWDCVDDHSPTWYYASPSMHQCILEAGADRPDSVANNKIRLVCNAAGGLLPSLACRLRDTFSREGSECIVLPSYGMTECMPISTPPLDYKLERSGTSGISVGPEVAVLDGQDVAVGTGSVGRICVRGTPVFNGYLNEDDSIDRSCFTENGWFDTGDLGYLDSDAFLYITGRNKEVINRGGELISPFEVEEAVLAAAHQSSSPTFGRVSKVLAFSVPHDVLQEVVGVCIVTPPGQLRTCLDSVQRSMRDTLSQIKIPVVLIYMDDGLPTNNNKVLRIKLAERMGLPETSDHTPLRERCYEAICPPPNTHLSTLISCTALRLDHSCLQDACRPLLPDGVDLHWIAGDFYPELFLASKPDANIDSATMKDLSNSLLASLSGRIDAYNMPSMVQVLDRPFPRTSSGSVDRAYLKWTEADEPPQTNSLRKSSTEAAVVRAFAEILSLSTRHLSAESYFFELGGDSMKAGRLLSYLRKEFNVRLSIDALFAHSRIGALATLIDERLVTASVDTTKLSSTPTAEDDLLPGCEETHSSTRPLLLLLQLVPLCLLYPMKRAFTWTIFMYCLSYTQRLISNLTIPGRLANLVVSMFVARATTKTIAPAVAILVKWMIIGRYKEGLYPMWSKYHTRWWICQKAAQVAGMGTWNMFNWSRCLYHRWMGAKIGNNVNLAKGVTLGEHDMITIEDGVVLDRCVVRPFAAERNTSMYLGRIRIGSHSSVGLASIVAAGTNIPPNTCIGPNSSSWEVQDADGSNRDLSASKIKEPQLALWLLLGLPIQCVCLAIGALPWLGCLTALVNHEPKANVVDDLRNIVIWFASPGRVALHYGALAADATIGPVFFFLGVLAVKKTFDICRGKLGSLNTGSFSQIEKWRMHIIRTLMPATRLHKLTELFGTHYEATSVFMRLMGAGVGKHVYWPGTGPSIQDFHLVDIGNDVVFGSRSHLVTSDGTGSDCIRIKDGAMVADRVILLPGVVLGNKSVMGSGALTRRNASYAANTTWVGSKAGDCIGLNAGIHTAEDVKLHTISNNSSSTTLVNHTTSETSSISAAEKGHMTVTVDSRGNTGVPYQNKTRNPSASVRWADLEPLKVEAEMSSPFGRAFYQGHATYRVWTQFEIFLYSSIITVATAIYWNIGSISAVQIVARMYKTNNSLSLYFLSQAWYRPFTLFLFFLAIIIVIMAIQSLVVLFFILAAKWILVGRRRPGCYSWDISPYCQRWQLYLKLESLRRHCYGGNGILSMLTGTHWIVLYFRALGANIGKDCALFAGGLPSLYFTEPDLLTLGDRVSVDDASLVGHINTRGKFDLNLLHVGNRSVLRTGSRLLSGARMEADTCLLEHTLIMAGDVVDAGRTCQGWPADEFKGTRMPTMKAKRIWRARD
jgi:acyl-CoA synthetase (AMP-forming)/AMP-acid ligase II/acetyltransferase-like isoleucine patch superfamily enzyme/acyl carrier protein